jgi:hypothetical protein
MIRRKIRDHLNGSATKRAAECLTLAKIRYKLEGDSFCFPNVEEYDRGHHALKKLRLEDYNPDASSRYA